MSLADKSLVMCHWWCDGWWVSSILYVGYLLFLLLNHPCWRWFSDWGPGSLLYCVLLAVIVVMIWGNVLCETRQYWRLLLWCVTEALYVSWVTVCLCTNINWWWKSVTLTFLSSSVQNSYPYIHLKTLTSISCQLPCHHCCIACPPATLTGCRTHSLEQSVRPHVVIVPLSSLVTILPMNSLQDRLHTSPTYCSLTLKYYFPQV